MKSANESLTTFGDGNADDDRLVPLRVVLRWIKQLRTVKKAYNFAGRHLKLSGSGKWALAAPDDSITLYTVDNLIGQAILAVPVTTLARAEQSLLTKCRIAPQDYADVMDRAGVYAILPPHRTAVRFANKDAFRERLHADFEARQARAVGKGEIRPASASEPTGANVEGSAGTSKASPVAIETRPGPQKRASSALSPPSPPSPPLHPDPAVEAATPATLRSTALPPTKKARPPLPGPAYSSPAVMRTAASTPSVPGPPRPTAITRPPSPAQVPLPPATAAVFTEAEQIAAAKHVAVKAFELEALRLAHEAAVREGAGAFLALDVEAWEFDHDLLLEFGWSILEYVKDEKTGKVTARRETQHVGASQRSSPQRSPCASADKSTSCSRQGECASTKQEIRTRRTRCELDCGRNRRPRLSADCFCYSTLTLAGPSRSRKGRSTTSCPVSSRLSRHPSRSSSYSTTREWT